jgi:hypothetical protein
MASRRDSPELCMMSALLKIRGRREGRVAAAPGAPAQRNCAKAREPQVQAVTCAVVYGLYVISPVNQRLPPSPSAKLSLR